MPRAEAAYWTLDDEKAYIAFLKQHRAEGGDSATFKMPTFNAAAVELEAIQKRGGKKDGKSCQNKWNALRRIFQAIQAIKSVSGWVWSDTRGADISPEMDAEWDKFILIHKDAKPFKNQGWVHLSTMTEIMPVTLRGTHVYRPSQGITGMDISATTTLASESSDLEEVAEKDAVEKDADECADTASETDDSQEVPIPWASSPPITSQQKPGKRERASSPSPAQSSKKRKTTTGNAIDGLTQSINTFGENICKVLAVEPSLRSPKRRKAAIRQAQGEIWLPVRQRLIFAKVIEKDMAVLDTYMGLDRKDDEFCRMWIQDKVDGSFL